MQGVACAMANPPEAWLHCLLGKRRSRSPHPVPLTHNDQPGKAGAQDKWRSRNG